jgi:hypothetical protein
MIKDFWTLRELIPYLKDFVEIEYENKIDQWLLKYSRI